jgi:hypothetical protein
MCRPVVLNEDTNDEHTEFVIKELQTYFGCDHDPVTGMQGRLSDWEELYPLLGSGKEGRRYLEVRHDMNCALRNSVKGLVDDFNSDPTLQMSGKWTYHWHPPFNIGNQRMRESVLRMMNRVQASADKRGWIIHNKTEIPDFVFDQSQAKSEG